MTVVAIRHLIVSPIVLKLLLNLLWKKRMKKEERGKEISVDRMDNEETLGMVFGAVTGNFMREQVIPELDAYRFAKYAGTSGISSATAAALTKDNIVTAIDEATATMDGNEVPQEGRILYVNSDLKPALNAALSRQWGSDSEANTVLSGYNGMKIVYVPKTRFYTKITLNDGSSAWGYAKDGTDGKAINFMMIHPSAVVQTKKFSLPKIFTPDENQKMDAWLFQFRLYHDCFVYDNKKSGIYLHANTK